MWIVKTFFIGLFALCLGCSKQKRAAVYNPISGSEEGRVYPYPEEEWKQNAALLEYPLAAKIAKRDGTNYLGVYLGMIALRYNSVIWPSTKTFHGVQMYSATSGELLRWISAEEFTNVYILKTQPEYPK